MLCYNIIEPAVYEVGHDLIHNIYKGAQRRLIYAKPVVFVLSRPFLQEVR